MNWAGSLRSITVGALIGGVLGLLVGWVLTALTDSIDNPFWALPIGIAVGAGAFAVTGTTRTKRPH